ncbi:hypothetical protein L9F63_021571, partial [Diploptera punctata]
IQDSAVKEITENGKDICARNISLKLIFDGNQKKGKARSESDTTTTNTDIVRKRLKRVFNTFIEDIKSIMKSPTEKTYDEKANQNNATEGNADEIYIKGRDYSDYLVAEQHSNKIEDNAIKEITEYGKNISASNITPKLTVDGNQKKGKARSESETNSTNVDLVRKRLINIFNTFTENIKSIMNSPTEKTYDEEVSQNNVTEYNADQTHNKGRDYSDYLVQEEHSTKIQDNAVKEITENGKDISVRNVLPKHIDEENLELIKGKARSESSKNIDLVRMRLKKVFNTFKNEIKSIIKSQKENTDDEEANQNNVTEDNADQTYTTTESTEII